MTRYCTSVNCTTPLTGWRGVKPLHSKEVLQQREAVPEDRVLLLQQVVAAVVVVQDIAQHSNLQGRHMWGRTGLQQRVGRAVRLQAHRQVQPHLKPGYAA